VVDKFNKNRLVHRFPLFLLDTHKDLPSLLSPTVSYAFSMFYSENISNTLMKYEKSIKEEKNMKFCITSVCIALNNTFFVAIFCNLTESGALSATSLNTKSKSKK